MLPDGGERLLTSSSPAGWREETGSGTLSENIGNSGIASSSFLLSIRFMFSHSGTSLLTGRGVATTLSETIPIEIVTPSLALRSRETWPKRSRRSKPSRPEAMIERKAK